MSPTGPVEGTLPEAKPGNPAAGKAVFAAQGCGGCHVFSAAKSNGKTGPNLDQTLKGKDEAYVNESIVAPDAKIAPGFQPGIMPKSYAQLPQQQVANLVAFLRANQS